MINIANNIDPFSREYYKERLIGAGLEIIMRADDMLGSIEGVQAVKVSFELNSFEPVSIDVQKTYTSEYVQRKVKVGSDNNYGK